MEARSRQPKSNSLGLADLVLRNQLAWRVLGNWESSLLGKRLASVQVDRPVFIAGLARAGTTILLRKLCELPEFVSHRYSDFPFLFTPYAWTMLQHLTPRHTQSPRERMHKDGIMVTSESPEAMEEVLWTAFFPWLHDPGRSNCLDGTVQRCDFEAFLNDHIRKLILARGGQRYISKNNYNVSRLSYLARVFPDARFLLPVREPVAHVASLMKQHLLFSQIQHHSEAARRHLRLVCHFEFGLDRRPVNPGDRKAIVAIEDCWACGNEVRGWAKYWALVYRHMTDQFGADPALASRCLLVPYEDLCERSVEIMTAICHHVGVSEARARRLAEGLHRPEYYALKFSHEERVAIAEETFEVAGRLGYPAQLDRTGGVAPRLGEG